MVSITILQYSHTMPSESDLSSGMGRSWRDTLHVAGREQAEQRLTELGYTREWRADGSLRVKTPRSVELEWDKLTMRRDTDASSEPGGSRNQKQPCTDDDRP